MRVLMVMNSSNVTYGGGIVQVILNYCGQLCKNVTFDFAINEKPGCRLHEMFIDIGDNFFCLPNKRENMIKYAKVLYRICKNGNYDVIHVHGNSANMLFELGIAKICGIKKRIAHCHNSRCSHPKANKVLKPIFNKMYTDAAACSPLAGDWIFGKGNFTIINNAIELERYAYDEKTRNEYRDKLGVKQSSLVIGHVGNINEQKNHVWILQVFAEIKKRRKDSELVLIGDGPLRVQTEKKAHELNIYESVHFLGICDDTERWMQIMDLFIFPSKWEGLGMVAVEAQAAGLYVIASEEVPQEAQLTEKFIYKSLGEPVNAWSSLALQIADKGYDRSINKAKFIEYDIVTKCNELLSIYENKRGILKR